LLQLDERALLFGDQPQQLANIQSRDFAYASESTRACRLVLTLDNLEPVDREIAPALQGMQEQLPARACAWSMGEVSSRPCTVDTSTVIRPTHVDGGACFREGTCLPAKGRVRVDKYLRHSCLHTHFW
jgi:hypothetical protein